MTRKRKYELVDKFLAWAEKRGYSISISSLNNSGGLKSYQIIELKDGQPLNTLFYDNFPDDKVEKDCWLEILEKRCKHKAFIDQSHLVGLGPADSLEEFELKLEIHDA